MGEVYGAHDEHLERDVAIKVLPPATLADDESRRRFRKEALVLSKLNHANIAVVHDFSTQDGVDYLVMELVPGNSLAGTLKVGPLPERRAAALGEQIASALEEAHRHGIIHRDLKPGNVMVTPRGQAKVLDFGLAKLLHPVSDEAATASVLQTEHAVGTLPYMAPEQLRGEPLDARTDIHALGAILYEMATGRRPFEAKLTTALAADIQNKLPEPLHARNPRVSAEFERIVLKCLEKDPENRFQSAKEVEVDLRRLSVPATTTQPVAVQQTKRPPLALLGSAAIVLLLLLLFGLNVGGLRTRLTGGSATPKIESLAVLPLDNLSGDSAQEYFADGMTEALITELAQLSGLKKVTSRTSVMQFKKKEKSMEEISRVLGVDAIIEGSVQRSGDRVGITVQLIDPVADRHLWAKSYERDARDILSLQREVARAIAAEIRLRLTPTEETRLVAARPVNTDAYNAYLQGLYYSQKRTRELLDKAVASLNEAIRIDPGFAPAYAALSRAHAERDIWGGLGIGASSKEMRDAARKAVELDPDLAEGHFALAAVYSDLDWDWQSAQAEYQRALELNPNHPEALHISAFFYQALGRDEEAITRIRRAVELAPTVVGYVDSEGRILYRARRYQEAIARYHHALDMDPAYPPIYQRLADAYVAAGKANEALAILEKGRDVMRDPIFQKARLAYVYAKMGRHRDALALAGEVEQLRGTERRIFELAALYAALSDKDRAISLLEEAAAKRTIIPAQLRDPKFDPLRGDPRFKALLRRVNLPE